MDTSLRGTSLQPIRPLYKPTRFRARWYDYGSRCWICPECGHLNRDRLAPGRYRFRCGRCESVWLHGLVLWRTRGRRGRPPDVVWAPFAEDGEAMLPALLGTLHYGECVSRIIITDADAPRRDRHDE